MKAILTSAFAILLVSVVSPASDSSIIVAADANIGNGIYGDMFTPMEDNGAFFANVLGAGTKVVLQEGLPATGSIVLEYSEFSSFYTGLGATVDAISSPFTSSDLAGADLLISVIPESAYTAGEMSLMAGFLSDGDTIFFMGNTISSFNAFINSALSGLGSGLSIVNVDDLGGFTTATGSQIAVNPLTAGVSNFAYASTAEVSGGTPLFFTKSGAPFVAVEGAQAGETPEPSTALLMLFGIPCVAVLKCLPKRRRGRQ